MRLGHEYNNPLTTRVLEGHPGGLPATAPLVVVEGADHMIPGRHPVLANLLIRDFVRSLPETRP